MIVALIITGQGSRNKVARCAVPRDVRAEDLAGVTCEVVEGEIGRRRGEEVSDDADVDSIVDREVAPEADLVRVVQRAVTNVLVRVVVIPGVRVEELIF